MLFRWMTMTLAVAFVSAGAYAQAPATPLQAPTAAPPTDPTLVTIGNIEITKGQVDALLAQLPEFQRSSSMPRALSYLAGGALRKEFVRVEGLKVAEAEYDAQVAEIRQRFEQEMLLQRQRFERQLVELRGDMALRAFIQEAVAPERVEKFIADHPRFFDGTKVEVSHILHKCALYDSTEVQREARQRLEEVVAKIRSRDLSFAEAAAAHSDCPSKAEGGALGEIEFGGPMDRYFTLQAFSTAEGRMSSIFRTQNGWHVLLVTKITPGDGTPKPWRNPQGETVSPEELARGAILSRVDNRIMLNAVGPVPVVNHMPASGELKLPDTPDLQPVPEQ